MRARRGNPLPLIVTKGRSLGGGLLRWGLSHIFATLFRDQGPDTCWAKIKSAFAVTSSQPIRSYMICTAPRSGSTLLCKLLAATQSAGNPCSHFHSTSLVDWIDDYELEGDRFASEQMALQAILDAGIERGKGGTDVFGLRMQGGSFDFFLQQLGILFPECLNDVDRIEAAFGPILYIHLSRPDRLGQAISRVLAEQTGLWHRHSDGSEMERLAPPKEPRFDARAIERHIAEAIAHDDAWEQWFAREGVDPIRISYDALSKDPKAVLAQLLFALNLDPAQAQYVEPPTAKLADALSLKWRGQYEKSRD